MTVLGDNAERAERGRRAQDRADIVRIGDLVEHEQNRPFARALEHIVEPHFLERLGFDHHALVRRVVGNQSAEICDFGERNRQVRGKLHERCRLARRPRAQHPAVGVVERGRDRMTAPETRPVCGSMTLMRFFAARHGPPMGTQRLPCNRRSQ